MRKLIHGRVLAMRITVNGQPRDVQGVTTIAELLNQLQVPARGVAVEVNQQLAPRSQHAEVQLQDGDQVEVVTLVGGG